MALADRILTLRRDEHSAEVLVRGGDPEAHSILQRSGFVPVVRFHEAYHRLPTGLDVSEEERLATLAVARLRTVGYHVETDDAFDTQRREPHGLTLGAQVLHLARRIREATTTAEAADVLTELTATHDGVLTALEEVLVATAEFYQDLGEAADPHAAARLRYLADRRVDSVRSDLMYTRNDLADRHQAHPRRQLCTKGVGPDGHEASAVGACPPPPRQAAATGPAPSQPTATGRRR